MIRALIIFLLFPTCAFACQDLLIPEEELLNVSESAYYGRVIAVSISEQQKEFGHIPDPSSFLTSDNNFGQLRLMSNAVEKVVILLVKNTLKGTEKEEIKASINWCNGGQVGFLDASTLYFIEGEWIIRPDLEYELRTEYTP